MSGLAEAMVGFSRAQRIWYPQAEAYRRALLEIPPPRVKTAEEREALVMVTMRLLTRRWELR